MKKQAVFTAEQTQAEVARVMQAIADCNGDAEISKLLRDTRNDLPLMVWREVLEEFSYIADFFVDSNDRFLSRMAHLSKSRSKIHQFKTYITSNWRDANGMIDLDGVEVSNASGSRFAFFCKDASCEGNVRFTTFDENGMSAHVSRPSYDDLIEEVISYGFVLVVEGKLDELSSKPNFFAHLKNNAA